MKTGGSEMDEVSTSIRDEILQLLEGGDDPRPPTSYFMNSIEMMAMSVFERNRVLLAWMKARGLDPDKGYDAVLGLGLLLALDAKNFPQPELEHYEMPDDHDH
jgi:hypothetical protein